MILISSPPQPDGRMVMLSKAGGLLLALSFLLLAVANPTDAQQGGVANSNEKVVSMNVVSNDRHYIVYLSWQPNGSNANIFDVFIDDSATGARLNNVEYVISLYRADELVASSLRTDQTTTRQFYNFEESGEYTVRISNIDGNGEYINFSIEVTPEFPLHMFGALAALFAGMVTVQRLRPVF